MRPFRTSLLPLSFLVPLEIARAYAEAFLPRSSIASPKAPAPPNRVPSDQSTNSAKAMSTQFYDTQVSTVDYQILFTKREREAILDSGRVIVTSAMFGSGFASWQISLFTQEKLNKDGIEKPENWPAEEAEKWAERYVPAPGSPPDSQKAKIIGLKPEYLK